MRPLHLDEPSCRRLLELFGPSLALWRAAEIAALREVHFEPPVLDLGCGDGLVTSMVLSTIAIGVDPDPGPLERVSRLGVYQRLEAAPAQGMAVPSGSIGTVLSNSVLEHVADLDAVLAAVARVLRPGGTLVVTTPTQAFSNWLTLPLPAYAVWRNRTLAHLNLWPVPIWRQHLTDAGLEIVEVVPYLRRPLVTLWDALELAQQVWIGERRVFSLVWRRLPPCVLGSLSRALASTDLGAGAQGGGRLLVARNRIR